MENKQGVLIMKGIAALVALAAIVSMLFLEGLPQRNVLMTGNFLQEFQRIESQSRIVPQGKDLSNIKIPKPELSRCFETDGGMNLDIPGSINFLNRSKEREGRRDACYTNYENHGRYDPYGLPGYKYPFFYREYYCKNGIAFYDVWGCENCTYDATARGERCSGDLENLGLAYPHLYKEALAGDQSPIRATQCYDSDGNTPSRKGYVSFYDGYGRSSMHNDSCGESSGNLQEFICEDTRDGERVASRRYECIGPCKNDGACHRVVMHAYP